MVNLTGRSGFECLFSWDISWIRPGKEAGISRDVSFLQDFYQPCGTKQSQLQTLNCSYFSCSSLFLLYSSAEHPCASVPKGCSLCLKQEDVSHVGGKEEEMSLSHRRWAVTPSFPPSALHPALLLSPVWSVVQVGAAASGGEISCLSQPLPVKCKLLKAHRSCVCSEAAVFSLAQHSPAACSDMSSVWLLQIMETRNTDLPGMSPTRQALLRLPLLYPPAGQTASDTRRQSVWEDNIKARACYRPFLESCHLRSGLDTLVAKPPHFHRMGFI